MAQKSKHLKNKKISKNYWLLVVFWAIVGLFSLILISFFVPTVRQPFQGPQFMLLPLAISLLGGILIWLTLKQKPKQPLRKFLFLTGGSVVGFLIFSVLHNFLYAIEILTKQWPLVSGLAGISHALFFILAVLVCPVGFLVGVIGSVVYWVKKLWLIP